MDEVKKKQNRKPTPRQIIAAKQMIGNGGSKADALRIAGYSAAIVDNPQKVTRSEWFAHLLDKAGLTDEHVAKEYQKLSSLRTPLEKVFYASVTKVKTKKGYRKKYTQLSDEFITNFISKMPGANIAIIQTFGDRKVAHYTIPLFPALKSGLELTSKSKGLMAPEKHDHGVFHEATPDEKALIESIFNNNKK